MADPIPGESRSQRMLRLADELSYALEDGNFDSNKADAFLMLWTSAPNQDKGDVRLNFRGGDMNEFIADLRRRKNQTSTKLQYAPVVITPPIPLDNV